MKALGASFIHSCSPSPCGDYARLLAGCNKMIHVPSILVMPDKGDNGQTREPGRKTRTGQTGEILGRSWGRLLQDALPLSSCSSLDISHVFTQEMLTKLPLHPVQPPSPGFVLGHTFLLPQRLCDTQ